MSEHQLKDKAASDALGKSAHPTQKCPTCSACVSAVGSIECHAQPPVGVPLFQAGRDGQPVVAGTVAVFPPVNALMWCRKWEARDDGEEIKPTPVPKVLVPKSPLIGIHE